MSRDISRDDYVAFDAFGLAELVHRGEVTPQSLAEDRSPPGSSAKCRGWGVWRGCDPDMGSIRCN